MNRQIPFDDIDKRKEKKQLKQRLAKAIRQLAKQLMNPGNQEKMLMFVNCLAFGGFTDVNCLPYYSIDAPFCKSAKKVECLFALICSIVQDWWMYLQEDLEVEAITKSIEVLERISEKQLINYKVIGNTKNGFKLESK